VGCLMFLEYFAEFVCVDAASAACADATVEFKSNTYLVDVPRLLVDAADDAGVKMTIDFSLVCKELRYEAGDSI